MTVDVSLRAPRCWDYLPADPERLRPTLRALLKNKTAHQGIDATAHARRSVENALVHAVDTRRFPGLRGLLLFNAQPGGRAFPLTGVLTVTAVDCSAEGSLERLAEAEGRGALTAGVMPLGSGTCVVALRSTTHSTPSSPLHTPEGEQLTRAVRAYYDLDTEAPPADVIDHTQREVSVWIPIPGEPRTVLVQFVMPESPLTDVLSELCIGTAGTVTFTNTVPAPTDNEMPA